LIVVVIGLLGYLAYYKKQNEKKQVSHLVFNVNPKQISLIKIDRPSEDKSIVLLKAQNLWKILPLMTIKKAELLTNYGSIKQFDATTFFVESFTRSIADLKFLKKMKIEANTIKELGLDRPRLRVHFKLANGSKHSFIIGQQSVLGTNTYVLDTSGESKGHVYFCDDVIAKAFAKSFKELRSQALTSFSKSDISKLLIKRGKGSKEKKLFLEKSLIGWSILDPITDSVNELELNKFIVAISTTNVKQFIMDDYNKSLEKKYGFHKPLIRIATTLKNDGRVEELLFSTSKGRVIVANLSKKFIAEIEPELFERLDVGLKELRDNRITHINKWEISKIEVAKGKYITTSVKESDDWETTQKSIESEEEVVEVTLNKDKIESYLDTLIAEKVADFVYSGKTPSMNDYGLFSPNYTVSLYKKNKEGKEVLETKFSLGKKYRHKGENFYYLHVANKPFIYGVESRSYGAVPKELITEFKPSSPDSVKVKLLAKTNSLKKLIKPFINKEKAYKAIISTNKGEIEVELYANEAPYTVSNFLNLSRNGFYDNLKFHRVLPGFLVQTGDPTGSGKGGPGYNFKDEINSKRHKRGALSMAKSVKADTNGSQFFICLSPQPHLDNNNTVFGRVKSGMEIVDKLIEGDNMISVKGYEVQR
jgi:peptidyl-prolyl cis-trans isomerase B (cyclophilin B)